MKVLVSDAMLRHSLAVVRSLASHGMTMEACSSQERSQTFYSRFCKKRIIVPDPSGPDFSRAIVQAIRTEGIDVFLPTGDGSSLATSRDRDEIQRWCSVAIPNIDVFMMAADKARTLDIAREFNIPTPATLSENDPFPKS